MNARDIETAAARIETARSRALNSLAAGCALALTAIAVAWISSSAAIALASGVIVALMRSGTSWLRRRELIERLALDPSAYAIPEVARFGDRIAGVSERRVLAASISALVHERGHPLELHLVARTYKYAPELAALAREFGAPSAHVEPATAVAFRRLVTRPVQSPLYNPNLPEEDLTALLLRIRAGISPSDRPEALAPRG